MADSLKQAEHRGYSKGYNAGRRKRRIEMHAEHRQRERQAFLDKAFLAALSALINAQGWKVGDVLCTTGDQRVDLAWTVALQSLRKRKFA